MSVSWGSGRQAGKQANINFSLSVSASISVTRSFQSLISLSLSLSRSYHFIRWTRWTALDDGGGNAEPEQS